MVRYTIGALFLLVVLAIGAADAAVHGAWVACGLLVGLALVAIGTCASTRTQGPS